MDVLDFQSVVFDFQMKEDLFHQVVRICSVTGTLVCKPSIHFSEEPFFCAMVGFLGFICWTIEIDSDKMH